MAAHIFLMAIICNVVAGDDITTAQQKWVLARRIVALFLENVILQQLVDEYRESRTALNLSAYRKIAIRGRLCDACTVMNLFRIIWPTYPEYECGRVACRPTK